MVCRYLYLRARAYFERRSNELALATNASAVLDL